MTSAYQTKQHNELLSLLKEHQNESLKANDILMLLKNLGVSISLATVYRQLEKLISKGLVIKILVKVVLVVLILSIKDKTARELSLFI